MVQEGISAFWALSTEDVMKELATGPAGLSESEAEERLRKYGSNIPWRRRQPKDLVLLLSQFRSPIIILLVFAALLSLYLHQNLEAGLVLVIVFASGILGFWQERTAAGTIARLLAMVQVRVTVVRAGSEKEIPLENVVPGDIIILRAGDVIPGDCRILEARDLFVNEAALTGETYPVEKTTETLPEDTPMAERRNSLFMGTSVVNGTATAIVVHTGRKTEFGRISHHLELGRPETDFERGLRSFGYFLMELTLLLVVVIFAINVYLERPVLESFLFSLALAVGLTPQLLPAIVSVNLAHGAREMAALRVIVKRLASIENFGSMNVLCCDKTGTLTEGAAKMHAALGVDGRENQNVFLLAYLNAFYQTGFTNPIDQAILSYCQPDISGFKKLNEVPYDFVRKRLSILVSREGDSLMITKGALRSVLEISSSAQTADGIVDIDSVKENLQQIFGDFSSEGYRVLGLAHKKISGTAITKDDESDMTFLGFLIFFDPPKEGIARTVANLAGLGVNLKMITGDNKLVASAIGEEVGLRKGIVLTGSDLRKISDEALQRLVRDVDIFAEVEPNQKERIILALRRNGDVIGYMGDGINDVSALHASDISISVENAVDIAKDAADIVLMEKDLNVLVRGVVAGRKTFANTMKYVFMATSANFGNMFSMALLSLFLPFLPMLPVQVLLTNLLTDLPEMAIATDSVDPENLISPRRWSIRLIRDFMAVFGLLSSLFDYLTFGALLFLLHANTAQFRTGWFMESVISASMVVLVIRTRRPFFRSVPSRYLVASTLAVGAAAILLPYTPLGRVFMFTPLPLSFLSATVVIVVVYVLTAEMAKSMFYRKSAWLYDRS
ncbi:MAG: magnesium-translocating P-type ATPase [Methanothrix sp.]|uniref:magnesium-translocating P-type ATPase n=1 Tax=Methanothrix sp. TaxID=90426 RepID=UPI0025DD647A|nr:magnesium-translocating P-type ATPase [Methanothrix sp.]MCQ8902808.1 magnesium-translocating P-type ATPase [Methanothrix sp.]